MAATTTTATPFSMAGSIPAMAEAKELQSDGCVPRWKRIDEGDLLLHTCVYSKPDFLSIIKFHDFVFFAVAAPPAATAAFRLLAPTPTWPRRPPREATGGPLGRRRSM